MPDITQNVVVDFTSNNEELKASVDVLVKSNEVSKESAQIYKEVNDEVQKNTALTTANTGATEHNLSSTTEQQAIYDKLSKSLIELSGQTKVYVQELLKLKPEQIAQGFADLGISVDEYLDIMKQAGGVQNQFTKSGDSLRKQLSAINDELARMSIAGQEGTDAFKALSKQGGILKDAIQTAGKITSNLSKESPKLALFAGAVRGVGAAFQGATAAEALFGAENKDLQLVMVKVNAAMALAQALNEAVSLAQDKAFISTAKTLALEKVSVVQKAISNGLESSSVVIRYAAAAAQKVLNFVMKENPILLLIGAITTYVIAMYAYIKATKESTRVQAEFNAAMDSSGQQLDAYIEGIKNATDKQNAFLEDSGAAASVILKNTASGLVQQNQGLIDEMVKLDKIINDTMNSTSDDAVKQHEEAVKRKEKLESDYQHNITELEKTGIKTRRAVIEEGLQKEIELRQAAVSKIPANDPKQFAAQKQLLNAQAALALEQARGNKEKQFAIEAALQKQLHDLKIQSQIFTDNQILALAEKHLIEVQNASKEINDRTTQEEIDAQKAVMRAQLRLELEGDKLTALEKKKLTAKTNQEILQLQKDFNQKSKAELLDDQNSLAAAELVNIKTTEEDKVNLRIETIFNTAQKEIDANKGKNAKIKEIEAKRDADVLQVRKESIDAAAQYELGVFQATTASTNRALEKSLSDQAAIRNSKNPNRTANQLGVSRKTVQEQFAMIDEITDGTVHSVQIQIDALNAKRIKAGQLTNDETVQFLNLQDQKEKAFEDGEHRKVDLATETADKQKQLQEDVINASLNGVAQGLQVLQSFYDQQDQAAQAAIDKRREEVEQALQAGAITAKAAAEQQKELDAQEKRLKHDQAVRNKRLAIFQAVVGVAQAVITALSAGPVIGIVQAAIAAAIGAAQIALIASQPIPQFNRGKKDSWSGVGEVAELKPEIVESGGQKYLIQEPTAMYLGPKDKVYTPAESVKMMEGLTFGKNIIVASPNIAKQNFDYNKLGQTIGNNVPQNNLEITEEGFKAWVTKNNITTKYFDRRRSWFKK